MAAQLTGSGKLLIGRCGFRLGAKRPTRAFLRYDGLTSAYATLLGRKKAALPQALLPGADSRGLCAQQYDYLVSQGKGRPPSRNPALLERVVPRFVLESQKLLGHALLLTQVGSFYEAHFDQAVELARLLGIKLAEYRYAGEVYPLAGFPVNSLSRHLKTLVNDWGRIVAIANQSVSAGSSEIERRVVRVVTPGTLVDEDFMDPFAPNFLLAVHSTSGSHNAHCGLAWLDVSTGSFFGDTVSIDALKESVARIAPKEIVMGPRLSEVTKRVQLKLQSLAIPISHVDIPIEARTPEEGGVSLITQYLARTLIGTPLPHLRPQMLSLSPRLDLDDTALKSLDIRHPQGEGSGGSLVRTIARTLTRPGRRLLTDRLSSPSIDVSVIKRRLDLVSCFHQSRHFREAVREVLWRLAHHDYSRLLQKIVLDRGDINDLHSMLTVLETSADLARCINDASASWPSDAVSPLCLLDVPLHEDLTIALRAILPENDAAAAQSSLASPSTSEDDDSEQDVRDNALQPRWLLRPDSSQEMVALHGEFAEANNIVISIQAEIKRQFADTPVKFRLQSKVGPTVQLRKLSRARRAPSIAGFVLIAETKDTLTVVEPRWSQACERLDTARRRIAECEDLEIKRLLQRVAVRQASLAALSEAIAEVDVGQGFATYADEAAWVRPSLLNANETCIEDGRHPIAEASLLQSGDVFQPNSTRMAPHHGLIQVITGPNNGGKSTYLRQVATIHILAQAGSFVPAKRAELGIVTACFTRLGASDDIAQGKGTFFVEMEETARILRQAGTRSLVLLDELGRGTASKDGISIGLAVVLHLVRQSGCRTIFATHLHDIADRLLEHLTPTEATLVSFGCTGMNDPSSRVLQPGVNRHSSGMQVAETAGVPRSVLAVARNIWGSL